MKTDFDGFDQNSEDEIYQIQNDINKLLSNSDNSKTPENTSVNIDAFSPETENVSEKIEYENFERNTANNNIELENLRKEFDQKNRKNLQKMLVVFSLVSILCSSFLTISLMFGFSFYNQFSLNEYNVSKTPEYEDISENDVVENNEESIDAFNSASEDIPITDNNNSLIDQETISNHFVELVNMVEPSVVEISVELPVQDGILAEVEGSDQASGTGIIFYKDDDKVYIITNAHVIANAERVSVSIEDNVPVKAKYVIADPAEDLAIISVSRVDLAEIGVNEVQVATFGDSDNVEVGEMVLAIGNALGEGNSATLGIISAKDQEITVENNTLTVLQTNAAINPGNSGGPLVNMNGEVIGINTAKVSSIYNIEGMGYSITSNKVKSVVEGFMTKMNKAFLGVSGYNITEEVADVYGIPQLGVFTESVVEGSSADIAGIQRGDIIVSYNGEVILSMEQLSELVSSSQIGETVEIGLIRNEEPISVDVTLLEYEDMEF